jgi:bis(5'-nucleosidyl)-tetraphosphatase
LCQSLPITEKNKSIKVPETVKNMEPLYDNSFGIIPVYRSGSEIRYLLILHVKGRHWAFPKGHANEGESPEDAAQREFTEESGITDYSLIGDGTFTENYTFLRDGRRYEKTVLYYTAVVNDVTVTPQQTEIEDFKWAGYEEALGLITFEESRELLNRVHRYLTGKLENFSKEAGSGQAGMT